MCVISTGCEGARGEKIAAKQIYVDLGPNIPRWSEYQRVKGVLITYLQPRNVKGIFGQISILNRKDL